MVLTGRGPSGGGNPGFVCTYCEHVETAIGPPCCCGTVGGSATVCHRASVPVPDGWRVVWSDAGAAVIVIRKKSRFNDDA